MCKSIARPLARPLLLGLGISIALPAQGLTVEQVEALRSVSNPQVGDGFIAFDLRVPRPLADGPGGSYSHVGVATSDVSAKPRWLVAGKGGVSGMQVRPQNRAVSYVKSVDGVRQLHVHAIDGDAATVWAQTPAVGSYRWRSDGNADRLHVDRSAQPGPGKSARRRYPTRGRRRGLSPPVAVVLRWR